MFGLLFLVVVVVVATPVQGFVGVMTRTTPLSPTHTPRLWLSLVPPEQDNDDHDSNDNNDDDKEEPVTFFDDFASLVGDGRGTRTSSFWIDDNDVDDKFVSLQRRVQNVQAAQMARVDRNWESAQWQVRGFTLDTSDAATESSSSSSSSLPPPPPITVTTLTAAAATTTTTTTVLSPDHALDDAAVWVGRSDGSLLLVRLGQEWVARFTSILTLSTTEISTPPPSSSPPPPTKKSTTTTTKDPGTFTVPKIGSRLVRNDDSNNDNDNNNDDHDDWSMPSFQIACQCRTTNNNNNNNVALQHVVAVDNKVFTVAAGSTDIVPWMIHPSSSSSPHDNDDDDDDEQVFGLVAQPAWTSRRRVPYDAPDDATIISMEAVSLQEENDPFTNDKLQQQQSPPTLLTSVASDGTLALWDIPTGALLFTGQVMQDHYGDNNNNNNTPVTITSATASQGKWILGTAQGKLYLYDIQDLVASAANGGAAADDDGRPCPRPAAEWDAHTSSSSSSSSTWSTSRTNQPAAITALMVWGKATIGNRGSSSTTTSWVVVSGDAQGLIQQWDLLPRSSSSSSSCQVWDVWPKMARQRVSERAHVLPGHEGAISKLTRTRTSVVSASRQDGTIRVWNPVTAQVTTRMDGFEEASSSSSRSSWSSQPVNDNNLPLVILHDSLLLTAGNGPHVTVHDFASTHPDDDDDLLENVALDWDGDT